MPSRSRALLDILHLDLASPRAPSLEQIHECIRSARRLVAASRFVREGLGADASGRMDGERGCGPLVHWSAIGALAEGDGTGGLAAWYARRLLTHLSGADYLTSWLAHPVRTRGEVLRLLDHADRMLSGSIHAGGWHVTHGAGVGA